MFHGIKLILLLGGLILMEAVPFWPAARNNMPKTKTYRRWLVGVVLAGVLLMLQTPMLSGAQDQDFDDQDPPSRVARLNYAQGSVTFQPGGEGDWVDAMPNRPLTSGDNLWTDEGARAELHVGSTAIRLAPETSMTVLDLNDRTMQLRLSAGSLEPAVRYLDHGDLVELDTPNLALGCDAPENTGSTWTAPVM